MRAINAIIGCILLGLGALHALIPHTSLSTLSYVMIYLAGAGMAFASLRSNMPLWLARFFAVATTALMFVYFAGFFSMASHFSAQWYLSGDALKGVGMLLSAFAMIPVLSAYSCLLKAECRESLRSGARPAFFRVPESVQEEAH